MKKDRDEMSLQILSLLQQNSRESFSSIGRKVGLSAPAIVDRIKRMEETGIIKNYTINISHDKLGFPMLAFMLINLSGNFSTKVKKTEKAISNISEILECHRVTGRDDMVIKVIFKDILHLQTVIDKIAPFGQLNTCIVVTSFRNEGTINMEKYIKSLQNKEEKEDDDDEA